MLDEREYEVPDFTDLTIDDWEIVYDECGCVLADFQEDDDPEAEAARRERIRNPRLEKAFIMVSLIRARPDDDLETIRSDAGHIRLIPYLTEVSGGEQENPTQVKKPDESSKESSDSSGGNSSPGSPESSVTPEVLAATTGTDG
jgi:hypothetical protein